MFRVGLTGGIASGKSAVAERFAELGVPVIDTDAIAREVVEPGQPALEAISKAFGAAVIGPDGRLDRARLRTIVFADAGRRKQLESILHPRIRHIALERAAAADGPYQLIVVPLLFETGFEQFVDRTLAVDCPKAVQRERLLARDGGDPAVADRMIAAQLDRSALVVAADDVIDNSGELAATRAQVDALHNMYLSMSAGTK